MSTNGNAVTAGEGETANAARLSRRGLLKSAAAAGFAIASVGVVGADLASAGRSPSAGPGSLSPLALTGQTSDPLLAAGEAGMAVLQGFYNKSTGQWQSGNVNGWWNSACCLYATIDYCRITGTTIYLGDIPQTFAVARLNNPSGTDGFVDTAYDDCGWWGITWVNAYDLTGNADYLNMAKNLFETMTQGWTAVDDGGVVWETPNGSADDTASDYKETIANELFLLLAALLHQRIPGDSGQGSYLDWAEREWRWFTNSGLINSEGLVSDGFHPEGQNIQTDIWTYNQGVILGGLLAMYEITKDSVYLQNAEKIADAALEHLTVSATVGGSTVSVLSETINSTDYPDLTRFKDDPDTPQFKGIFMRYLYKLAQCPQVSNSSSYKQFILNNAASIHTNDASDGQFGFLWQGREDDMPTQYLFCVQSSAMEAINAAIAVKYGPARPPQSPGAAYPGGANLVSNPSGADGTNGWYKAHGDGTAALTPGTYQGSQALQWVAKGNTREDWVYVYPDVTNGNTYTYAVQLAGSGTVIFDAWTGDADLISMPVTLKPSFQTVSIQAAIPAGAPTGQSDSAPQLQIATVGPADVTVLIRNASVAATPA
jgi:predicted alpha-1,6-mannanase (GH76 family)